MASAIPQWKGWFPNDQILSDEQVFPEPLQKNVEFVIDGRSLFGVDVAHSDTQASSFLHVTDLKLVVAGDIDYGECFQFLAVAKTAEKGKIGWTHLIRSLLWSPVLSSQDTSERPRSKVLI